MKLRSIKFCKAIVSHPKAFYLIYAHRPIDSPTFLDKFLDGIPTVYWFGVEGDYTVLIMAILGPNLQ